MQSQSIRIITLYLVMSMFLSANAGAEVKRSTKAGGEIIKVMVSDDSWQPDPFKQGIVIPANYAAGADIVLDGVDDEAAWLDAKEVTVPLAFGNADSAQLKALYTDKDVLLRIRWADASEDRLHRPWVWNEELGNYEAGPQIEDSLMLSFEAGCEWFPSFLAGYSFDFDAWHWMAGRTDPLGHALDKYGSVKMVRLPESATYASRNTENEWNLKFTSRGDGVLHKPWDQLDRKYEIWPLGDEVHILDYMDGGDPGPTGVHTRSVAAPENLPATTPTAIRPSFELMELPDNAGDVLAKGHWENGFWTVELRRQRFTDAGSSWDFQMERLTQFSMYVFDSTEKLDEASESQRLFLQFLDKKPLLASQ